MGEQEDKRREQPVDRFATPKRHANRAGVSAFSSLTHEHSFRLVSVGGGQAGRHAYEARLTTVVRVVSAAGRVYAAYVARSNPAEAERTMRCPWGHMHSTVSYIVHREEGMASKRGGWGVLTAYIFANYTPGMGASNPQRLGE